jgi:uncharacterized protein YkvS
MLAIGLWYCGRGILDLVSTPLTILIDWRLLMSQARSTTNRTRFKVGDLVEVAPWCVNKGLTGVVTKVKSWSVSQDVYVCFPGHDRYDQYVQKNNLILVARGK